MSWTQTKKHNKQNCGWKKEILNEEKTLKSLQFQNPRDLNLMIFFVSEKSWYGPHISLLLVFNYMKCVVKHWLI